MLLPAAYIMLLAILTACQNHCKVALQLSALVLAAPIRELQACQAVAAYVPP